MLLRYVMMCVTTLIDSRSNNVSLIEIIEQMQTDAFPLFVNFDVVCLLEKEPGDQEIPDPDRMRLKIELNDVELREIPVSINFAGHPRTRFFAEVRRLRLREAGRLDVKFLSDGKQIGSCCASIVEVAQGVDRRLH